MDRLIKSVDVKVLKYTIEDKPRVFVCGGGSPVLKEYYEDAYNIGQLLAKLGVAYVQGGLSDRKTMMGESYHGYKDAGGDSAYFISRKFGTEDILEDIKDLKGVCEVKDIADLLRAQYLWSDVVIMTPGGTGTLIEMLSYIEQKYDYPEQQPTVIIFNKQVNSKGFFDSFFEQIKNSQVVGFVSHPVIEENFIVVDNLEELKEELIKLLENKKIKKI